MQTDQRKRADLFRQAETLLVVDEPPIVPIYFYAGFNYFDPQKIDGIYQNILDEHPCNTSKGSVPQSRARCEELKNQKKCTFYADSCSWARSC